MNDIFISYSRKDIDFVTRLSKALREKDLEVWVDLEKIPISADWWQEIERGIEGANTFIFVLSPSSMTSPICHLEIAHAIQHNKRLIPILHLEFDTNQAFAELFGKKLDDNVQQTLANRDITAVVRDNWNQISSHNFLFFTDDSKFNEQLDTLIKAHNQDLAYVREHTRLEVRARYWEAHDRNPDLLLKGSELRSAISWLESAKAKDPKPTSLHQTYIETSKKHAVFSRGIKTAIVAAALAVGLLAGFFFFVQDDGEEPSPSNRTLTGSQLNIAIAEIGVRSEPDGAIRITDDSRELSVYIRDQLAATIDTLDDPETPEHEVDIDLGYFDYVEMDKVAESSRLAQVAALANDMSAQVVIYGYVDMSGAGQPVFYPEFYVSPDLFGVSEISGPSSFGEPIAINYPIEKDTSEGLIVLEQTILPRVRALRQLLTGLAYYQVGVKFPALGTMADALTAFENALAVEGTWAPDGQTDIGQALINLWIGSVFERTFLLDLPADMLTCPTYLTTEGAINQPLLDCALAAYEQAISLDADFARAYIGVGNVYMDAADAMIEAMGATLPDACELGSDRAADNFAQARTIAENIDADAFADPLIEMKAVYNTAIAYRDTHARGCYLYVAQDNPDFYLIPARENFAEVESIYHNLPPEIQVLDETKSLLASALLERAQAERSMDERTIALETLVEVIDIAYIPDKDLVGEKPWQQIRWKAHAVRSAIYIELATLDSANAFDHWRAALEEAERVISRLEEPGVYDDQRTIHNAYYFAGRAEEALGNNQRARDYYAAAIEIGEPTYSYYIPAQERLAALSGES